MLLEISLRIVNRNALSIYCLDLDDLDRFLFHCNSLLKLSQILSPGYCRARALIQFYSSQGMMLKARKCTRGWDRDDLDRKRQLFEIYNPIHQLQKESLAYFKTEDENDNRYRAFKKGYHQNQYVACLGEEMHECLKSMNK
jgi:hypothetical protein